MLNTLITFLTTPEEGLAATLQPLQILLGLAIGLALLGILLQVLHTRRYHSEDADSEGETDTAAASFTPAPAKASAPMSDDAAIVAAITAAIAAMRAEEGNTGGFRVVSFKRVNSRKNRF